MAVPPPSQPVGDAAPASSSKGKEASIDDEIEAEFFEEEPSDSPPEVPESAAPSMLPPPPPLPKQVLARGRFWHDGVVPEAAAAFLPPLHFSGPAALSQPALDELHRNQAELCRAVGYNQTLIMVREHYARSHADCQRLKAQVGDLSQRLATAEAKASSVSDLREELEVAEAKARSAEEELVKAWAERDEAREALVAVQMERDSSKTLAVKTGQELELARAGAEKAAEECAQAVKERDESLAAARVLEEKLAVVAADKEVAESALAAEKAKSQELADGMVQTAEACFKQALRQIRHLNPGADLQVEGYGPFAFVKDDGTYLRLAQSPAEEGDELRDGEGAPEAEDARAGPDSAT